MIEWAMGRKALSTKRCIETLIVYLTNLKIIVSESTEHQKVH